MNKKINVLIFPCGAENALEVLLALKDVVNIEIFGASGRSDHGEFVYKNYISSVPFINDVNFVEALNGIVDRFQIDIIFPTHDDVVVKLAQHEQEIKAKVLVHGLHQAEVTRSKRKTYETFKDFDFCPKVFTHRDEVDEFPVFAKPDNGQGGKGARLIEDKSQWESGQIFDEQLVFTEYLPGMELTVDCFTASNGVVKFIGPRLRERVTNGISTRSSAVALTQEIEFMARSISDKLRLNGLWYFQVKKNAKGEFKLLEVSLRVAGTMNLFRARGVNLPLLAIYNAMNYEVSILENSFEIVVDRALINRYQHNIHFDNIYIDFDDTITKDNWVNEEVLSFLYYSKGQGKRIVLITKHAKNIYATLEELCIHSRIFDEIIVLNPNQRKSTFIPLGEASVFIDNAFAERQDVFKNCNIPVFDVDAIQVLMNKKN